MYMTEVLTHPYTVYRSVNRANLKEFTKHKSCHRFIFQATECIRTLKPKSLIDLLLRNPSLSCSRRVAF